MGLTLNKKRMSTNGRGRRAPRHPDEQFEHVALVHLNTIYRAAVRLTRDLTEAEDLTQEIFLRAYRSFHQFKRGTNCRAWLFKILKNTHINQQRLSAPSRMSVSLNGPKTWREAWPDGVLAFEGAGPERLFSNKVAWEQVERAVEALPEVFQRAFILSCVQGFSYKEVAEMEACPLGTVMSRLYRARRMLQSALWDTLRERQDGFSSRDVSRIAPQQRRIADR